MIQTSLMALELSLKLQLAQKIHNPSIQVRNEAAIRQGWESYDNHFTDDLFLAGARSSSIQRIISSRSQSSARVGQALRSLARSDDSADEISSDNEPSPDVSPRYVPKKTKTHSSNYYSHLLFLSRRPFPEMVSSPERRISQDALRSRLDRITHLKKQLRRAKQL